MLLIVLTCIRQEIANEWQSNTVKDLLLPDNYVCTVSQKDEKTDTTWQDVTSKPHIYISITDWEIQGVKQVLYSYKILFFQTAPILI